MRVKEDNILSLNKKELVYYLIKKTNGMYHIK